MASLLDYEVGAARKHVSWRTYLLLFSVLAVLKAPQPVLAKKDNLREITDGNWEDILTGEWMIEFFAPWCPACRQLQPVWGEFAEWGDDLGINIAKVDVTEQPGLSGRFIITSLPTIYHCKEGVFRRYQGPRTKDDFLSFVDEKKWQTIDPVSSWFGPSSLMMNTMSALFKLSMFIRHCHNYLTEQLGIPVWGSYVIFALATLFSGLILGLILVFVADFVFPSRRFQSNYYQRKQLSEQARLQQQLEDEQMADGEEEDEEDDEDEEEDERGSREQLWHHKASADGRPDTFGDEALRRRVLATRREQEEEEEEEEEDT